MTPAQLLGVVAALGAALLLSEGVLSAMRLHRLKIGPVTWMAGMVALAVAAHWADQHTGYPAGYVHTAALVVAALWTCLWFNDHAPLPVRSPGTRDR